MKRNKLKAIALLLAAALVIPGCIKSPAPVSSEEPSSTEPVVEPVDTTWERPDQTPVSNEPVVQSGNAVKYNGKILFRVYDKTAIDYTSLFADFSTQNFQYCISSLYTYDCINADDQAEFLIEDNGYGDLYLVNGYLYSQTLTDLPDPETGETFSSVYRMNLETGKIETIGEGRILGFSDDGKYIYVVDYDYNPYTEKYQVYEADTFKLVDSYVNDSYYEYLGNNGNSAFYMRNIGESGYYDIVQHTNNGKTFVLGHVDLNTLDVSALSYPAYDHKMITDNDEISFNLHFFEGTGHFYYTSINVRVKTVTDTDGTEENYRGLFTPTVTEYTDSNDNPLNPVNPRIADKQMVYPENPNSGFVSSLQYAEDFEEGVFYVSCDAVRDPSEDIGWRMSYFYLNSRYYFLPNDAEEPVEIFELFPPAGTSGDILSIDPNKIPPTITVMAFFPSEDGKEFDHICYEPVSISGPEAPIEYSGQFFVDKVADVFIYEYPQEDIYEPFYIDNFEKFKADMASVDKKYSPIVTPSFDYEGNLEGDEKTMTSKNGYYCHIAFDEEGNINYVRPVIWD